uniref:Uncharacterized protein n=1 Tax=Pavo cristatus TaxID=9049 RepID=A0A8C9L2G0_PAVCR
MNKDAQMRATINQKLIETGERERRRLLPRPSRSPGLTGTFCRLTCFCVICSLQPLPWRLHRASAKRAIEMVLGPI